MLSLIKSGLGLLLLFSSRTPLATQKIINEVLIREYSSKYEVNADLTEWTFHLRPGVLFHDGSSFDANDVVVSLSIQWDAANPLHTGNTGAFSYWSGLFGAFLNAPPAQ